MRIAFPIAVLLLISCGHKTDSRSGEKSAENSKYPRQSETAAIVRDAGPLSKNAGDAASPQSPNPVELANKPDPKSVDAMGSKGAMTESMAKSVARPMRPRSMGGLLDVLSDSDLKIGFGSPGMGTAFPGMGPGIGGSPSRTGRIKTSKLVAVYGKINAGTLKRIIRRRSREIKYCYSKGLYSVQDLSGTVKVDFIIDASGRVVHCSVSQNLSSRKVGQCICFRIRSWKFPKPAAGIAKVLYSWTFAAK